jgi:hypothetical protein
MKKIRFKLCIYFFPFLILGCATNDSNSPLVRFWNDGFIMTEKKSAVNQTCSREANRAYPSSSPSEKDWDGIYSNCMKKNGY